MRRVTIPVPVMFGTAAVLLALINPPPACRSGDQPVVRTCR